MEIAMGLSWKDARRIHRPPTKIVVSGDTAKLMVNDSVDDWNLLETSFVEKARWTLVYSAVFKQVSTGNCYMMQYEIASNESTHCDFFGDAVEGIGLHLVKEKKVTTTVWEQVKSHDINTNESTAH